MELTSTKFEALSMNEVTEINGGGPLTILAVCAAVKLVADTAKVCYELGTYTGKALAHWLS
ncbi:hypothetical protein [Cellulosilyticum lentocellum]|uniref:Class IIb bacteriocin, lactobin A/cerein 7B family n=1 Tax=Cellulosilyticum lentocellum (strain ATCC 49066 / DSM 5427 / NCIMB 11756 / RHM5) TaxID=642492 RepID=F2JGE8_CELLD|nr:hypothetical protein [Cellulosilyticum lentocellum]ADZ81843.1 hypothetical protein Clole_0083 [Cellulosilyticum lentocellum DSM 5427]